MISCVALWSAARKPTNYTNLNRRMSLGVKKMFLPTFLTVVFNTRKLQGCRQSIMSYFFWTPRANNVIKKLWQLCTFNKLIALVLKYKSSLTPSRYFIIQQRATPYYISERIPLVGMRAYKLVPEWFWAMMRGARLRPRKTALSQLKQYLMRTLSFARDNTMEMR